MSVLSNEQTLVTGSFDHTLEVWDTLSSKNVGTLLGHADRVWCCVALANDWVVSGSFDCTLRVWDVEQARCLSTLKGHRDRVWCVVALSRCRVASGSLDRTLRVWDCITGNCLGVLEGHSEEVRCVVSLKDDVLASSGDDRTIKVWDLTDYRAYAHPQRPRPLRYWSRGARGWKVSVGVARPHAEDLGRFIWKAPRDARRPRARRRAVAVLPGGRLASGSHDRRSRWNSSDSTKVVSASPKTTALTRGA